MEGVKTTDGARIKVSTRCRNRNGCLRGISFAAPLNEGTKLVWNEGSNLVPYAQPCDAAVEEFGRGRIQPALGVGTEH